MLLLCSTALAMESARPDKAAKMAQPATTIDLEDGSALFMLEHSISDDQWKPRGNVELQFGKQNPVKFADTQLSSADLAELKKLVDNHGYYRIRLVPTKPAGTPDSYVMASVPACALVASGYRELLNFHSDVYGNIIAVDYRTPITQCEALPAIKTSDKAEFKPKGKILFGRTGERPKDVRSQVQQEEEAAKNDKEPKKGFFAQYWMYIIPGVLIVFMQMAGGAMQQGEGGK